MSLLIESCVERLIFDGGESLVDLVSVLDSLSFVGASGSIEESGDDGCNSTIIGASVLDLVSGSTTMVFSVVASRTMSGDLEDEYSATSILGEGRISLIFTSVMTGISETGVISLIVISCLTISFGTVGTGLLSTSSTVEYDVVTPGMADTPEIYKKRGFVIDCPGFVYWRYVRT